jgi:hypothetical protein
MRPIATSEGRPAMAILVDFRCRSCGHREEQWTSSPPPAIVPCGWCGADSHRAWAAIGLSGTARPIEQPRPPASRPRQSMCAQFPQVPGLCHMSESAGRMWVAKYLNDRRAVDREWERQEKQAAVRPSVMADVMTHHHYGPPSATMP